MKVLQIHNQYRQRGGEDHVVATEAELLRRAGHTVVRHGASNPEGVIGAARAMSVAPWNVLAARRVHEAAARIRPDVVHVHNTWYSLTPAIFSAVRSLGLPVVMTLHNYRLICAAATLLRDGSPCLDCVGTHPGHGIQHRCYRGSRTQSIVAASTIALHQTRGTWHRDVDRFLALSHFGREQFVNGGLPADRIVVKANAVHDPGPRSQPPSTSRTVVFVGRLSPEKGIATLLEAWRKAPPQLELAVIGDGPLSASLRASAPERVTFHGLLPADRVSSMLLEARALVFPSVWYEGQPLVPLEAASAGLPVLFSDLGAMSEMFAPDAHDLAAPPGDVAGLASALARLADDRFVDRYGAFTRRRFEERYTHQIATSRLESIYAQVIDGRPDDQLDSVID